MSSFEAITSHFLDHEPAYTNYKMPEHVHIDDPSNDVMFNLEHYAHCSISSECPISQAQHEMEMLNVHLLLVFNNQNKMIGLVSSRDILSKKPLQIASEKRITHGEILVRNIMTPVEKIPAIKIENLKHALVGNIIKTMKQTKSRYLLVIEESEHLIKGIFDQGQLARQLHRHILENGDLDSSLTDLIHRHKDD